MLTSATAMLFGAREWFFQTASRRALSRMAWCRGPTLAGAGPRALATFLRARSRLARSPLDPRSIPARSPLDPRSARLARSVTHSPGPGPGPSPGRSVAVARSLDTRLARSRSVGRSVGQAGGHPGRPDRMLSPACDAKDPRHHASARTCIVHMHKGKGPGAGQGEHTCSLAELGCR